MEIRHYTEKGKHICLAYIVFLLADLRLCDATDVNNTVQCFENEYEHNGFCCDKCHSGFKLTKKCSGKGLRSTCTKCSDETYQDHMNHFHNCFSCRKPCSLDDHEVEIEPCTHKQDRKCGCENGYYENEINDDTMLCVSCRKCEPMERETRPCGGKMDRKCECKHNYYRVAPGICAQCKSCSSECSDFCKTALPTQSIRHPTGPPIQTTVWVCLFAVIVIFCIISLYTGVKKWKKRTFYNNSSISDPEKQEEKREPHADIHNIESKCHLLKGDSVLPDCVPREFKTHEFIYFLLDIVPIGRFKELVRRLSVSEQDIDRAERDNRAYADAQYQMLMVWVGGQNIPPCQLLQSCVETLKDMNLTASAEGLFEKFGRTFI